MCDTLYTFHKREGKRRNNCAERETRTPIVLRLHAPEACVSTNFTISACAYATHPLLYYQFKRPLARHLPAIRPESSGDGRRVASRSGVAGGPISPSRPGRAMHGEENCLIKLPTIFFLYVPMNDIIQAICRMCNTCYIKSMHIIGHCVGIRRSIQEYCRNIRKKQCLKLSI